MSAEYFSKAQAASQLEVSVATLDRRVKAGLIPAYRRGNEVVFLPQDVERVKQEALSLQPIGVAANG